MAATAIEPPNHLPIQPRGCFSFAAYAKNIIDHLKSCNVPVDEGLTDDEFAVVESSFNLSFPPDLRTVLQEGLPVGNGFPNWRSSSSQQLEILTKLPISGICKEVSRGDFWVRSWGEKPEVIDKAVRLAKKHLKNAPVLVPIYGHCYIPSAPNLAGNPVFYVHGGDAQVTSFDMAGFFHQVDFTSEEGVKLNRQPSLLKLFSTPTWAATEARRIEFWTALVERGGRAMTTPQWWSGDLEACMEDACCRLKDGGWKEEEVREMTMMDGDDESCARKGRKVLGVGDKERVVWHVRVLSLRLLRAGWSMEDVVDALGCCVVNGISDRSVQKNR